MDDTERLELARRIWSEVGPLIDKGKDVGGYNCCGCSTYDAVLVHAVAIVLGDTDPTGLDESGRLQRAPWLLD